MPRKYTHIRIFESQIIEMREAGKTRQEIADELGLTKGQIKEWVKRYNKRNAQTGGSLPKQRGRKPAITLAEYKYENKRLQMENELLRDFLRLAGGR
ncbi:MAG: helix-turn-helix domain-containing protein [Oscillospiraceae bacterium]|nr:helix-turn-helix domain-containing protein [Oscillospiraceae bacterium]